MRIEVDVAKWHAMIQRAVRMAEGVDRAEVIESIAELHANQVKRRINEDKTSPDGKPWKPWSDEYKKTRKAQHSLLVNRGHMMGDIAGEAEGDEAIVFSSMIYAGRQESARPFLGMSDRDASEIEQMILDLTADL